MNVSPPADTTAGQTINRFCSSGLQSIAIAAQQIASGQTEVAIAGGVDSISMGARQQGAKAEKNPILVEQKPEIYMAMGNTAEVVARRFGLLGHETATLEEVGQEIGLTRERVRQIQVEALKRLRRIMERQGLSVDALLH